MKKTHADEVRLLRKFGNCVLTLLVSPDVKEYEWLESVINGRYSTVEDIYRAIKRSIDIIDSAIPTQTHLGEVA